MKREIKRMDRCHYVLVPRSDAKLGHASYRVGKLIAEYIMGIAAGRSR
jgi:hypothetical protein